MKKSPLLILAMIASGYVVISQASSLFSVIFDNFERFFDPIHMTMGSNLLAIIFWGLGVLFGTLGEIEHRLGAHKKVLFAISFGFTSINIILLVSNFQKLLIGPFSAFNAAANVSQLLIATMIAISCIYGFIGIEKFKRTVKFVSVAIIIATLCISVIANVQFIKNVKLSYLVVIKTAIRIFIIDAAFIVAIIYIYKNKKSEGGVQIEA